VPRLNRKCGGRARRNSPCAWYTHLSRKNGDVKSKLKHYVVGRVCQENDAMERKKRGFQIQQHMDFAQQRRRSSAKKAGRRCEGKSSEPDRVSQREALRKGSIQKRTSRGRGSTKKRKKRATGKKQVQRPTDDARKPRFQRATWGTPVAPLSKRGEGKGKGDHFHGEPRTDRNHRPRRWITILAKGRTQEARGGPG